MRNSINVSNLIYSRPADEWDVFEPTTWVVHSRPQLQVIGPLLHLFYSFILQWQNGCLWPASSCSRWWGDSNACNNPFIPGGLESNRKGATGNSTATGKSLLQLEHIFFAGCFCNMLDPQLGTRMTHLPKALGIWKLASRSVSDQSLHGFPGLQLECAVSSIVGLGTWLW